MLNFTLRVTSNLSRDQARPREYGLPAVVEGLYAPLKRAAAVADTEGE